MKIVENPNHKTPTFIEQFDNVLSKEQCECIISVINNTEATHTGKDEYGGPLRRNDYSFFYQPEGVEGNKVPVDIGAEKIVHRAISKTFHLYCDKYISIERDLQTNWEYKFQKTNEFGGYHIWHYEVGENPVDVRRELTWMIYLNDIEEGGETEFLYQGLKVKPKAGSVLWWPAGYTHTHRGNPVYGGQTKYIVTGWSIKKSWKQHKEFYGISETDEESMENYKWTL